MRYWKVSVTRGHMGTGKNHGILTFFFKANNALEASDRALRMPGVKHSGHAPLSVKEISVTEYTQGRKVSAYDRAPMISSKISGRE